MTYFDEPLQQLRQQVNRKKQLEAARKAMEARRDELLARISELERVAQDHPEDCPEAGALDVFFCSLARRKEERMDRQRRGSYAARIKMDAAVAQLHSLEERMGETDAELSRLNLCQVQYEHLLEERSAQLKEIGGLRAEVILQVEGQLFVCEDLGAELEEASFAGSCALGTMGDILSVLDSCREEEGYRCLAETQSAVELLMEQLRQFRREILDVAVRTGAALDFTEILRFSDFFFGGLYADWAVSDRIEQACQQLMETAEQVSGLVEWLTLMMEENQNSWEEHQRELERLVCEDQPVVLPQT